jgi:uncharacterized caspase-like protein
MIKIKKYRKTEPEFPRILSTVFTLTYTKAHQSLVAGKKNSTNPDREEAILHRQTSPVLKQRKRQRKKQLQQLEIDAARIVVHHVWNVHVVSRKYISRNKRNLKKRITAKWIG